MATGCIHSGTIAGKLKGVIPTHTPSGWRKECASTPPDTCSEYSPLSIWGRPQANSTTSRTRLISPLASSTTLPCSEAISRASSSMWLSSSSRNANMTFERRAREASDHSGSACWAALTARSTSGGSASTACACSSPLAGSHATEVRVQSPAVASPPIRCSMVRRLVSMLIVSPTRFAALLSASAGLCLVSALSLASLSDRAAGANDESCSDVVPRFSLCPFAAMVTCGETSRMGLENPLHIAVLLVVLLLVFGARRLPALGRSLGSGMREFKGGITGASTTAAESAGQDPAGDPRLPTDAVGG